MTDTDPRRPSSRRRLALWAAGSIVLVGLVVGGIVVTRNGAPSEVSIAADSTPLVTEAAPNADTAQADPAPAGGATGSGDPITISGASPIDGRTVDLASFRGKPVVLQIWASWCPGCNAEAPEVAKLSKERTDVAFVGLNYRDNDSEAKGFYDTYGWTFPSIRDSSGEVALGLGLQGTPTTILLDADHREVGRILGETTEAGLTKAINQLTGVS